MRLHLCFRAVIVACAVSLSVAGVVPWPPARAAATTGAGGPEPLLPVFQHVATLEAEVDFQRQNGTGRADTAQVDSNYVDHGAGWMLSGAKIDGKPGISLAADSVYRFDFLVQAGSEPQSLPSSPVFTLQVRDPANGSVLAERLLHASDFPNKDSYYTRSLWVSTIGGHTPRLDVAVYWHGQVNALVDRVDIEQYVPRGGDDLESRMLGFEEEIQNRFLEQGLLVGRLVTPRNGQDTAERGDSATFTSLYTMAEAMRVRARPGDQVALAALQSGFRATDRLFAVTHLPGVMARYADAAGNWKYQNCARLPRAGVPSGACATTLATCPTPTTDGPVCPNGDKVYTEVSASLTSEDALVGYALAVAYGYPLIADPALKAQVGTRMREVANLLVNSGFSIPAPDRTVWFTPYVSSPELLELLAVAYEKAHKGNQSFSLVAMLPIVESPMSELKTVVNVYNSLRGILNIGGCNLPHVTAPNLDLRRAEAIAAAFDQREFTQIVDLAPEHLDSVRAQIVDMVRFSKEVARAASNAVECIGRLPNSDKGQRFRTVLRFAQDTLIPAVEGYARLLPTRVSRLEDLPIKASRAAEALLLLHAARLVDPSFDIAYYAALDQNLPILETWLGIDEQVAALAGGDEKADIQRTSTNWRGISALITLAHAEPIDAYQVRLRQLAEDELAATWDEHNPLYDAYALLLNDTGARTDPNPKAMAAPIVSLPAQQWGLLPGEIARPLNGKATVIAPDLGVMAAQLDSLPAQRRHLYPEEVATVLDAVQARAGGVMKNQDRASIMRDPLPLSLVDRGQMFWPQRNPRKLESKEPGEAFNTPELGGVLAFWTAAAAGVELNLPQAVANVSYVGPTLIASTGQRSLTLGRGYDSKCKTSDGNLYTDFPMPTIGYHPVQNVTGLDMEWTHARIFRKQGGQTSFSVNGSANNLYWRADVCRRGWSQPGGEIDWQVDITAPTRTQDDIASNCPRETIASSGERGVTQGRTFRGRKTKGIDVWVPLPAGWPALTPLSTDIGGSFEDRETKVSILTWEHVDWARIQRVPNGVWVHAQVSGSSGGGGEIKFVAELKGRKTRVTTLTLPRKLWMIGQWGGATKTLPVTAQAQGCGVAPGRWKARVVSGEDWGLNLRSGSGTLEEPITVVTAATDIPLSGIYSGQVEVSLDGASPAVVDVGMLSGLGERKPITVEAETGTGGIPMWRSAASNIRSVYLPKQSDTLRLSLTLTKADIYAPIVRYSNDNWPPTKSELVRFSLDGVEVAQFVAGVGCCGGYGWNTWLTQTLEAIPIMPGTHQLELSFEGGDGYGIEFDKIDLIPVN